MGLRFAWILIPPGMAGLDTVHLEDLVDPTR